MYRLNIRVSFIVFVVLSIILWIIFESNVLDSARKTRSELQLDISVWDHVISSFDWTLKSMLGVDILSTYRSSATNRLISKVKMKFTTMTQAYCSSKFLQFMRQNYSTLHREGLRVRTSRSQSESSKFVVFNCKSCGGFADRLEGIMNAALIAILTRRVLLIRWGNSDHDPSNSILLQLFDQVHINWTYDPQLIAGRQTGGVGGLLDQEGWFCGNTEHNLCLSPDPVTLNNIDVLVVGTGQPITAQLFNNERHRAWKTALADIGLTHDYAFGCLMRQIMSPSRHLMVHAAHAAETLTDSSIVSIGVHIRLGDVEFNSKAKLLHRPSYQAAAKARAERAIDAAVNFGCSLISSANSQKVLIFFISDSFWLRNDVRGMIVKSSTNPQCSATVVSPQVAPRHVDLNLRSSMSRELLVNEYLTTAGEWWLLGLCTGVVIQDEVSGFSRTAYGYSMQLGANLSAIRYKSPGDAGLGEQGFNFL